MSPKTTILGGGLGGLSAAHYLLKRHPGQAATLVEASGRIGGWIKSTKQPDGVIFEQGARTVRPKGPQGANTLALIEELNLSSSIRAISAFHPAATNRLVYADSKLHLLPSSLSSLFKKQSPFSKPLVHFLLKDAYTSNRGSSPDESIYNFVTRRFGQEVGDYLIAPMICGICAGDAKEISVKFLMESLHDKERKHGSITRGFLAELFKTKGKNSTSSSKLLERSVNERWSVYTFDGGIEILPKALEQECRSKGADLRLNTQCTQIDFGQNVQCSFKNGKSIDSDRIISAIPAAQLGKLVKHQHPQLADLLARIKCVSLAVVNLQFNKKLPIADGFGFLVCPKEKRPILGVIYDSCCFSYQDKTVLTVMLGGHWFYDHFHDDTSEEEFLDVAMGQIKEILRIEGAADSYKVNILKNAIPQYTVGHNENLARIESYIAEKQLALHLCGCSYHGVGINDVIMSARKLADAL